MIREDTNFVVKGDRVTIVTILIPFNLLPVHHKCLCRLIVRVFILMYICCSKVTRKMNYRPGRSSLYFCLTVEQGKRPIIIAHNCFFYI